VGGFLWGGPPPPPHPTPPPYCGHPMCLTRQPALCASGGLKKTLALLALLAVCLCLQATLGVPHVVGTVMAALDTFQRLNVVVVQAGLACLQLLAQHPPAVVSMREKNLAPTLRYAISRFPESRDIHGICEELLKKLQPAPQATAGTATRGAFVLRQQLVWARVQAEHAPLSSPPPSATSLHTPHYTTATLHDTISTTPYDTTLLCTGLH
jgi:hypothetical protein